MKIDIIKDELENDPLSRNYSAMTNKQVAKDLKTAYRPGPCDPGAVGDYFVLGRKGGMSLLGRLDFVSTSTVGAVDPLGDVVTLTLVHITAAKTMMAVVGAGSIFSIDLNDTNFGLLLDDLAGGAGAKVIGPADKTALVALSDNRQTRAFELDIDPPVRAGDIQKARAQLNA